MKKSFILGALSIGASFVLAGTTLSVVELFEKGESFKGKEISIKGKVVKVSEAIMGKNWVHIQDGTGDAAKKTNDIIFTSNELPSVGSEVTASGVVTTKIDLGYGYKYDVLVEKATFK